MRKLAPIKSDNSLTVGAEPEAVVGVVIGRGGAPPPSVVPARQGAVPVGGALVREGEGALGAVGVAAGGEDVAEVVLQLCGERTGSWTKIVFFSFFIQEGLHWLNTFR